MRSASGDMSHLASIFILLHKIIQLKVCLAPSLSPPGFPLVRQITDRVIQSCSGISFKSQVLYLIVYVTRYLGMANHYYPNRPSSHS